jgi:hypothetical protein
MVIDYLKIRKYVVNILVLSHLGLGFVQANTVVNNKIRQEETATDDNLSYKDFMVQFFSKIEQTKLSLQKLKETCDTQSQELASSFDSLDECIQKFKNYEDTRFLSDNVNKTKNKTATESSKMFDDNKKSEAIFYDVYIWLLKISGHRAEFCDDNDHKMTRTIQNTIGNDLWYALHTKHSKMVLWLRKEEFQAEFEAKKSKMNEEMERVKALAYVVPKCKSIRKSHLLHGSNFHCYCLNHTTGQFERYSKQECVKP